jgi:SulP family sulfate permease
LLGEISGSVGDLGISLPLAFALVVSNGFPVARIFLLWGLVYLATGWYYRVPVSVQPLKAMAVIAIAASIAPDELASTAFFYGVIFVVLARTGAIAWLERLFTRALVQGVQLGLGLILAFKAIQLVRDYGIFLSSTEPAAFTALVMTGVVLAILLVGDTWLRKPMAIFVLAAGLVYGLVYNAVTDSVVGLVAPAGPAWQFTMPQLALFPELLVVLMLPQLPLTLGNAVFAASDACQQFWPGRATRATPTALATSIGVGNVGVGLLGGFPICHGAGGIAAHARFGGKTGLTTMFLGAVFIVVALVDDWSHFLFLIPVPVLGALLLLTSWALIRLCWRLQGVQEWIVALVVGGIAFGTRHLSLALLAGLIVERVWAWQRTGKFHLILPRDERESP